MTNKKSLFVNRLNISVFKIMGLIEEVADGLDLDSDAGIERVSDRFNTILFNLEEAFDTVVIETEEEAAEKPQTFDEFIDEVMDYFDYEGAMKEIYRPMLIASIDELKRHGGGYVLAAGLKDGAVAKFKLTVKNGSITIDMEGNDTVFYFKEEEEEEGHHDYSGSEFEENEDDGDDEDDCNCYQCQWEQLEDEDTEDEESYQHEDTEEEEEENVHEEVNSILSYISSDIDELEKVIGNYFGNEKLGASSYELTEDDYALIRIYLIHVIEADRDEVNKLTDRGLLGAWNYHLYIKNN